MNRLGDWCQTFSGVQFWPLDPRPEEIRIEDIAHALSLKCRFNGHCRIFHSVAAHSVWVSEKCDAPDALWGLLHDAAEAYLVDMPRPVKRCPEFAFYRELEDRTQRIICQKFGLSLDEPASVKLADARMLITEKRDIMGPPPAAWDVGQGLDVDPYDDVNVEHSWSPRNAEQGFLWRFRALTR